jgi:hypothetical protein
MVERPVFAHGAAEYLNAFVAAGLQVTFCREWRPRDLETSLSPKMLKRGPDLPLIFQCCARLPGLPS